MNHHTDLRLWRKWHLQQLLDILDVKKRIKHIISIIMSQDSLYYIFSLFISWTLSHILPQNQIRDYRLKLNLKIIGSDIIAIVQASFYDQKELKLYTCQEKHLTAFLNAGWVTMTGVICGSCHPPPSGHTMNKINTKCMWIQDIQRRDKINVRYLCLWDNINLSCEFQCIVCHGKTEKGDF